MTDDLSALIARLRAEVPYEGKSRVAFQCHEAADAIESLQAELVKTREQAEKMERNRDMWKGQCDRQAAELTQFHQALAEWKAT